jgi:transposase
VVLEATYGWYWAADTLAQAGATVHLAHPLGVKMFTYRRVKNDERDAADLADLLRMGRLPESWIAPPEIRGLRELVRYRHKLVGIRTSCKDQIHAVLAKCGVFVPMADVFGAAGQLTSRRSGDLRDCVLSPRLAVRALARGLPVAVPAARSRARRVGHVFPSGCHDATRRHHSP